MIDDGTVGTNMHLAFTVDTRAEVDTSPAALDAGASSRESPGVHPDYHADDPHGINLEAVCHDPAS